MTDSPRLSTNSRHPLAGRTRRLHSSHPLLHGRRFKVLDWYANCNLSPRQRLALKLQFARRCRGIAQEPVTADMEAFFADRCLAGYLDADSSLLMLADKDEVIDFRLHMQQGVERGQSCALERAKAVLAEIEALAGHWLREQPLLMQILQSMKPGAERIVEILSDSELIYSQSGIDKLDMARQQALFLQHQLAIACTTARQLAGAAMEDMYRTMLLRKDNVYHERVGAPEAENAEYYSLSLIWTMLDSLQGSRGPHDHVPSVVALFMQLDDFHARANACFKALKEWEGLDWSCDDRAGSLP